VVVVMDVRHPLTELDLRLLDWLRAAGRRAHVLLTKADKLSRQAAERALSASRAQLAQANPGATCQLFRARNARESRPRWRPSAARSTIFGGPKTRAPAKGE
jgi:GTP-binding protein